MLEEFNQIVLELETRRKRSSFLYFYFPSGSVDRTEYTQNNDGEVCADVYLMLWNSPNSSGHQDGIKAKLKKVENLMKQLCI
jgi:hypothetical protein